MCVYKNHAFICFGRPPSWSGTMVVADSRPYCWWAPFCRGWVRKGECRCLVGWWLIPRLDPSSILHQGGVEVEWGEGWWQKELKLYTSLPYEGLNWTERGWTEHKPVGEIWFKWGGGGTKNSVLIVALFLGQGEEGDKVDWRSDDYFKERMHINGTVGK